MPAPEHKIAEVAQVPPGKPTSEPAPAASPPATAIPAETVPEGTSSQPAAAVPVAPPPAAPPKPDAVPAAAIDVSPSKPDAAPAAAIDVSPSVAISKVLPRYPAAAKQMRIGGKVDVDAQVDDQGRVTKAAAVNGPGILQEAAVEAVKKWKFKPATLHGANISSTARVTVIFGRE
jgi:protein TonB